MYWTFDKGSSTRTVACLLACLALTGCDGNGEVKDKVKKYLKDPASAEFRDIRKSKNGKYICGEVNAKNSMGGYTGYQGFAVDVSGSYPDVSFELSQFMDRCMDLPGVEVEVAN